MKNFFLRLFNSLSQRRGTEGEVLQRKINRLTSERARLLKQTDLRYPTMAHLAYSDWLIEENERISKTNKRIEEIDQQLALIEATKIINP